MGVAFAESMRGRLVERSGTPHRVDFDLRAEASSWSRFLRSGETRVWGVIHIRSWVSPTPFSGRLRIRLAPQPCIDYSLRFSAPEPPPAGASSVIELEDAGHGFHLYGSKRIRPRAPLQSLTRLDVTLARDASPVAIGTLHFDWNELPAFLATWSVRTTFLRLEASHPDVLDPRRLSTLSNFAADRGAADRPLSTHHPVDATLAALIDAVITPGRHVPAADATTLATTEEMIAAMPDDLRRLHKLGLRGLDLAARVRHSGHDFASLSVDARRDLLRFLYRHRAHHLLQGLTAPIKSAHFGRRDYLNSIDLPRRTSPAVAEPPSRPLAQLIISAAELEAETCLPADVVVIGSGAGGAPVAAILAEHGLAVAIVEEGPYLSRSAFSGSAQRRMRTLWRRSGMQLSHGNLPLAIPTGRLVGGTTAINSGTCLPPPPRILQSWRNDLAFPADFAPAALAPHIDAVLRELQVTAADPDYLGPVAAVVARGADALGLAHGPLPRNAPGCDGQGTCPVGCPTDARRSTNVSYIPRALAAGAHLFTGFRVTRLLRRGRRVVAIEAHGRGDQGAPRRLRIEARAVVLSCGTLATPLLLRANGFDLPALGRNLSLHPAVGMFARLPAGASILATTAPPWSAIPQGYGVADFADPRLRAEGFYAPPDLSAPAYPFVGAELSRWMDAQRRIIQFGFMLHDRNVGRVRADRHGHPRIRYDLPADLTPLLARGAALLAELLLRGGAEEVMTGIAPLPKVDTIGAARSLAERRLRPQDFQAMAFHPLGTARLGADSEHAVTDFEHRVFGSDNLYVADGSSVPTALGVNPQITIMALATRAAHLLATKLE
jgi:choline dehydrogenase-like flavoprotein